MIFIKVCKIFEVAWCVKDTAVLDRVACSVGKWVWVYSTAGGGYCKYELKWTVQCKNLHLTTA